MLQYKIGRKYEYKYLYEERGRGNFVFRTAGSHSPADLVIVTPDKVKFVQIKTTKGNCFYFNNPRTIEEWKGLEELKKLNPQIDVEFIIIFKRGKGRRLEQFILHPGLEKMPSKVSPKNLNK